jgi:hypothetical protein
MTNFTISSEASEAALAVSFAVPCQQYQSPPRRRVLLTLSARHRSPEIA